MIYFVQALSGGPVKIGTTSNLSVRLRTLESHYGRRFAVLATMPGGRDEERAIHERFAHLRFGKAEQFRPAPELMEFIGRPLFAQKSDVEPMKGTAELVVISSRMAGPEYRAWLGELSDHCRSPIPTLTDLALVDYAQKIGFTEPAPKRTMRH